MNAFSRFAALTIVGVGVFACKVENQSQTFASQSGAIVTRPNCYTRMTVAALGTKHAAAQDLKVFYANGNCHGFKGGAHEQRTLDRYALAGEVLVAARPLDGKVFPETRAEVRKLCLVGKRVVAARSCETASANDQLVGSVAAPEVGQSIEFEASKIAFDISYDGAAVDKTIARRVGMEKIKLWLTLR